MRGRILFFIVAALLEGGVCRGETAVPKADEMGRELLVARLLGCEVEELDGELADRLGEFLDRPLRLNSASLADLLECGLFTQFQAVSLDDYMSKNSGVYSLMELSAVYGFNETFVRALAPFVDVSPPSSLPKGRSRRVDVDAIVRGSMKPSFSQSDDPPWSYGAKVLAGFGGRFTCSAAVSRPSDGKTPSPSLYTAHFGWNWKGLSGRTSGKVLLGDFNARFGQGLVMYSGVTLGSLTSVSSFSRRSQGVSRSWSFNPQYSLRGAAFQMSIGHFSCTALLSMPGLSQKEKGYPLLPCVDLSWYFPSGQISLTGVAKFNSENPLAKVSVSERFCLRGVDVFSELAWDILGRVPSGVAGVTFPVCEGLSLATLVRYYHPDFETEMSSPVSSLSKAANEHGLSLGGDFNFGRRVPVASPTAFFSTRSLVNGSFSIDAAGFPQTKSEDVPVSLQVKIFSLWNFALSPAFTLVFRVGERFRTWGLKNRTDLRTELCFESGSFKANLRLNALKCVDWGLLGYVEGGWRCRVLALNLRQGIFRIDDWNDRIYVYERDAPGSFNVPAFYGRGLWTSFNAKVSPLPWLQIHLRSSGTFYPFPAQKKKPGKAELKLQLDFRF